jgi:hypothetical protein
MEIHLIERGIGKVHRFIINIVNIELLSIIIGHAKDIVNIPLSNKVILHYVFTFIIIGHAKDIVNISLSNENPTLGVPRFIILQDEGEEVLENSSPSCLSLALYLTTSSFSFLF